MAYQSNAVDILGSLLAIGPAYRADRDRRDSQVKEGIEGLAKAGGQVYGYVRRKGLTYKGDEYLNGLKAELADLEQEKITIENQIRTIQNEDQTYGMTDTEPFKSAGEGFGPFPVEPNDKAVEEFDYTAFEGRA